MLNYRILCRLIGSLLFVETGMFLLCMLVSLIYGEDILAFIYSALITFLVGLGLKYVGRKSGNVVARRDAFFVVAITWIVFSVAGLAPMMVSGACTNVTDAFFETMSGFTTTGTTLLPDLESLPKGLLFWRSLTHWMGGLGIIIFTLALLSGNGESSIRLFSAEATGITHEKLHPRIRTTVMYMIGLYVLLTLLCAISLYLCGIGCFDSINHALSTIATGGFSTHNEGIAYFHSPAVEYVESFFMFLSGINFPLVLVVVQRRRLKALWENNEFCFYLGSVVVLFVVASVSLMLYSGYDWELSIRSALFNVIAIQTSTGFFSDNFVAWWQPLWFVFFFIAITGGCAGSTAGGIKCIRFLALMRMGTNHFRQMVHPNAYIPVRLNRTALSVSVEQGLMAFIFWYLTLVFVASLAFSMMGVSFFDAVNVTICNISNLGTTAGINYTPYDSIQSLPEVGKWICSFLMLAGRLEIFPLLLPLVPAFWKNV